MNKKIAGVIIAIVVIAGGVYLINRSDTDNTSMQNEQDKAASAQGRVVMSVTDMAANMSTISEITMKVSSVDMHSNTDGWVSVSNTPRTYSLLMLNAKNESDLLADINAKAGTYDQVRLSIDSVSIKTKAGATKEAVMPSGTLTLNTNLMVKSSGTSHIKFDFLADKSLHTADNGNYVFAPVVTTEAKSGTDVSVDTNNVVTIGGGQVDSTANAGMDIDGSVKSDFQIDAKQKINLDSNNAIKLDTNANTKIDSGVNVDAGNILNY